MKLKIYALLMLPFFVLACGAKQDPVAQVDELPQNFNPNNELAELQTKISQAASRGVDYHSPTYYIKAKNSLSKAQELKSERASLKKIAAYIQDSKKNLKMANFYSDLAHKNVPDLIKTHERLLLEKGDQLKAFNQVEADFVGVMKLIEKEDLEEARKESVALRNEMDALITEAIKRQALYESKSKYDRLKKESGDLLPQTTSDVRQSILELEKFIENNRNQDSAIVSRSESLRNQVQELEVLLTEVKLEAKRTPEETVLRMANLVHPTTSIVLDRPVMTKDFDQSVSEASQRIQNLKDQNQNLVERENQFNSQAQEYKNLSERERYLKYLRGRFSSKDANIFERGDEIVIQLTGLSFAVGKYTVPSEDYELLGKLARSLKGVDLQKFTVKGHTDTQGSKKINQKLATRRALAVRDFLKAQDTNKFAQIQIAEAAYNEPVKDNLTKEGRSANRRVDIIILPGS